MFIKVGMNNSEQCLYYLRRRKIKGGQHYRDGSRKITSIK